MFLRFLQPSLKKIIICICLLIISFWLPSINGRITPNCTHGSDFLSVGSPLAFVVRAECSDGGIGLMLFEPGTQPLTREELEARFEKEYSFTNTLKKDLIYSFKNLKVEYLIFDMLFWYVLASSIYLIYLRKQNHSPLVQKL